MKTVSVLNLVNVADLERNQLLALVFEHISYKKTSFFFNVNSHGIYLALKSPSYLEILNAADVPYADGWGPVLLSKMQKTSLDKRINVGDYIDYLLALLERKGVKIYFLGCEDHVVVSAVEKVKKRYPNIKIVGYHNGFFNMSEEQDLIKEIKNLNSQVIFLGMGNPQQEEFLWRNKQYLPQALYITVGGVFHYLARTKKRAPIWMREKYLEWLYRLFQEPKRLYFRYSYELAYIGIITIRNLFINRLRKLKK